MRSDEIVHDGEQRHLPHWRERSFWLVEHVEAVASETVLDDGEKGFTVRLLVKRARTVGRADWWRGSGNRVQVLDLRRHVEEALGTQKEAVTRARDAAHRSDVRVQLRMRRARTEAKVARPAFGVEPE